MNISPSIVNSPAWERRDRAVGVLLGTATGDALGWITEFIKSPTQLQQRFGVSTIDHFYPWRKQVGGRFQGYEDAIAPGSYSDDTQLTIATAACIRPDGTFDLDTFSKEEFPLWLEYARGAGGTVKEAAKRIQRQSAQWNRNFFTRHLKGETRDYRDAGANGVVMRVAPHILANVGRWEQAQRDIFCNGIISHGHPRALIGALIYGLALHHLLQQSDAVSGQDFIATIGEEVKALEIPPSPSLETWLRQWNEGRKQSFVSVFNQTKAEAVEQLRYIWRALQQSSPLESTLQHLGVFAPETKGSGIVTAVSALYLFARSPETPWENIVTTANLIGSDTDSIAAVVGALGGALFGEKAIPEKVQSHLQDAPFLVQLGEHLGAISLGESSQWCVHPEKRKEGKPLMRTQVESNMEVYHALRGRGQVTHLETQSLRSQGKTATLIGVKFEVGQSAVFGFRTDNPSQGLRLWS